MDLYETKYNAALERAEMLIEKLESTHIKGFIYHIFPELIMSNEEQIRKKLIKAFGSMVKEQWGGIAIEDILDWLEKQGHMLDADKVIEWFRVNWWDSHIGNPIEKFKKDFGL